MSHILRTVVAAAIAIAAGGASRAAPGDDIYARPGILAAAPGTRLNLNCLGTGSPAVVFEFRLSGLGAGLGSDPAPRRLVHPRLQL